MTQAFTSTRPKARGLLASLPLISLLLATTSLANAQFESPGDHAAMPLRIEGSWIFSIHLTQPDITFSAFASFGAGGVFLATGANDRLVSISPLIGSWRQMRPDRFSSTEYYFVFDSTGHPVATQRANIVFRFNGRNELTGVGETDRCDLNGKNCVPLDGKFDVIATRIVPEKSTEILESMLPE